MFSFVAFNYFYLLSRSNQFKCVSCVQQRYIRKTESHVYDEMKKKKVTHEKQFMFIMASVFRCLVSVQPMGETENCDVFVFVVSANHSGSQAWLRETRH